MEKRKVLVIVFAYALLVDFSSSFAYRQVATGPDGDIYVRHSIPNTMGGVDLSVGRFSGSTGEFLGTFVPAELTAGAGLYDLEFLFFSPSGVLYVASQYDRVFRFTGTSLDLILEMNTLYDYYIVDMQFGSDGNLYLGGSYYGDATGRATLLRFNASGDPLGDIFDGGSGPITEISAMADAPNGGLYLGVYDSSSYNYKVVEMNLSSGNLVRDVVPSVFNGYPQGIRVGPGNDVFVSLSGAAVERFSGVTGESQGILIPFEDPRIIQTGINTILFDTSDNLLVATTDPLLYTDILVHRYDSSTGAYIDLFVSPPPVQADDNFYIADLEQYAIFRYERDTGAFLDTFTYLGAEEIVFGPDSNMYAVTGYEVARLHGETGAYLSSLVYGGSGGLEEPVSIAFSPDGTSVLVSDRAGEAIRRFNSVTGEFIEDLVPFVNTPGYIALNPDGDVAVISGPAILLFDGTTGDPKAYVSAGSGGLSSPRTLTFGPDENLYVTNFTSNQILRFDGRTGAFQNVFAEGGPLVKPRDSVFGPGGDFFVTTDIDVGGYDQSQVIRYSAAGDFIGVYVTQDSGYMTQAQSIVFGPGESTPGEPTPTPRPTSTLLPTPRTTPTPTVSPPSLARWEVLFGEVPHWMDTFDQPALTTLIQEWRKGTLGVPTPTPPPGTFGLWDHLQFAADNTWYYVGYDLGLGTTTNEDNFRWTVESTFQDLGGGRMAHRVRTDTDEPTDDRNLDVDFWFHDDNGDVFFYGFHKGQISDLGYGITFPPQDIVFSDPLLVGGDDMMIGVPVTDTGEGSFTLSLGTYTGSIESTLTPVEFRSTVGTPLGTFTNVLVLVLDADVTVDFGGFIGRQTFSIRNTTFFLKDGAGVLAHNQTGDPNDAQAQAISEGTVGGVPVVAN